jgi:Zn-finger domain-containing protein
MKECEESAQEARRILGQVAKKMWQDSDFFSFALATQILGKFEEALTYYEQYEQKGGYADSSLYYNKACIYARLGNREKMADMMRLCVDHDSLDWVAEMRHDTDFQAFWEDSIIEELEQYVIEQRERLPF